MRKVQTIFSAVNKVSRPVQKMGEDSRKAGKSMRKSFSGAGKSLGLLKKFALAAGAALVTGKFAKSISNFAEMADKIGKTSKRLGVSAKELQEWNFIAERSGASAGDIEKAFEKMNETVGKATAGTGRLKSLLEKTNPQLLQQVRNADSSQDRFSLLMKSLSGMTDQSERAALANAAFGSSGQKLLNMADEGEVGIKKLREEFEKYGGAIDEDGVKAAAEFQDSMTNLKSALEGLRNRALVPIIKAIQPMIKSFREWVGENKKMISLNMQGIFTTIGAAIKGVVAVVGKLVGWILQINAVFGGVLIPLILGGVVAFKAITIGMMLYQAALVKVAAMKLLAAKAAGVFNAVMAMNPIALVVIAVVALIAIIVLLVKNWDKVSEFFIGLWDSIKKTFIESVEWVKNAIAELWQSVKENFMKGVEAAIFVLQFLNPVLLIFNNWDLIKPYFVALWEFVKTTFNDAISVIVSVLNWFNPITHIQAAWSPLTEFFSGIWASIIGIFDGAWKKISATFDKVVGTAVKVKNKVSSFFGFGDGDSDVNVNAPVSPNSGNITSRQVQENRSQVDINVNDPKGRTSTTQRGNAPGVNLNAGPAT